jgi:hypothetical protein
MTSREWNSLPPDVRADIERAQQDSPIKIGSLAKGLGLQVSASTLKPGISGEIRPSEAPGGFTIRVNRHDAPVRQRFTIAHEIAHYLLHRDQIGQGIVDDVLYRSSLSDWREAEANRLAADLLMPRAQVNQALDRARALGVEDIPLYLAGQFRVSEAAMRIRLGLT